MHNIHHILTLMGGARTAILNDRFPAFVRDFFATLYGGRLELVPAWARDALGGVGVELLGV